MGGLDELDGGAFDVGVEGQNREENPTVFYQMKRVKCQIKNSGG